MASQQQQLHSCLPPTQFVAHQDSVFMDKDFSFNSNLAESKLSSCFPTEFPYEFDSFGTGSSLSSPEDSVLGSFENESADYDDFFAGLTRRLSQQLAVKPEKKWVMAGSPESTLNGLGSWSASSNGSPNGVLSPPTTPFGAKSDTWDLIHEAAGEIARLKLNSEMNKLRLQDMNFMGPTRTHNSVGHFATHSSGFNSTRSLGQDVPAHMQFQHQMRQEQVPKRQCSSVWGRQPVNIAQSQPHVHLHNQRHLVPAHGKSCVGLENVRCVRPVGVPHSHWPSQLSQASQQHQHLHNSSSVMRAVFLGGSGVKRECAGTGVFLPRRYGNSNIPPEPKKKTSCPTVLLPAKVVHALNLNLDDMKTISHDQPNFNGGFPSEYDLLLARRNAILAQQRRNLRPQNHEIRLPQEWTY